MPPVNCPECNHEVMCPEDYLGKNWRCPDCRTRIVPRVEEPTTLGWNDQGPGGADSGGVSTRMTRAELAPPASTRIRDRVMEWLIAAAIGAGLMWWWLSRGG